MFKFPDLYNLFHSHLLTESVRLGVTTHGFSLLMFNGQLENIVYFFTGYGKTFLTELLNTDALAVYAHSYNSKS